MQKSEGVILDDGNFVGLKSSLHPCFVSRKRMASVSFFSFEKNELRMRKKISTYFSSLFCPMKKILTSFLGQIAAKETLVQLMKPWILYIVFFLTYRRSNTKNTQKSRFFQKYFQKKPMMPNFY